MKALEVVPLTGRIGAEIRGVRLSPQLDAALAADIHAAWLRYKVIFFRGQEHLDDQAQEGLSWIFGGPSMAHPTVPVASGTDYIYELDSRLGAANYWHTDLTWADQLPRGSILRAVVTPPCGGDTMWANTATAYDDLPPRLRTLAERGWAIHSNGSGSPDDVPEGADGKSEGERAFWSAFRSKVYETWHPMVHDHPETHEPCLLLGKFVRRLVGVPRSQSALLYALFQSYVTRPENTIRWHWSVGDVAVWDNRATQHYAIADYGDARRVMHRVSIAGEPTVSLYGQPARTITREALPPAPRPARVRRAGLLV